MPPSAVTGSTTLRVQRGASVMTFAPSRTTRYEWAPNDDSALWPRRCTPSPRSCGKAGRSGRRSSTWPTERVGQTSTARHAIATSSGVSGWRTKYDTPSDGLRSTRPGATWRAASQSMQRSSTNHGPGAPAGCRSWIRAMWSTLRRRAGDETPADPERQLARVVADVGAGLGLDGPVGGASLDGAVRAQGDRSQLGLHVRVAVDGGVIGLSQQ